jgi:hypothetical protein
MDKKAIFPGKFHFFGKERRGRQKKGDETFMAEKTANIVLAVTSIVVLLLLGYALGGMIFKQQAYQQAKSTMAGIEETIDMMKAGDIKIYLIESPKNWILIDYDDKICMCKPKFSVNSLEINKEQCISTGVCLNDETNKDFTIISSGQLTTRCDIRDLKANSELYSGSTFSNIFTLVGSLPSFLSDLLNKNQQEKCLLIDSVPYTLKLEYLGYFGENRILIAPKF